MRNLKVVLGASMATVGAVATLMTGAGNAAAAGSLYGCPSGAVCVYAEGKDPSSGTLTHTYWSYGAHNLSNQYGWHAVVNNQTGGASADVCHKYGGGDCYFRMPAGTAWYPNLTDVNSIRLNLP
ncbi:hypothetical protein [Streptomyces laurentii]|uniref:hypothetical protein n=1 Tax=Streptomyces laurentii TaxID=39478 RepID=UPI003679FF6B